MLDQFYISIFNYYKKSIGKRSLKIAMAYINLLELSILLVIGAFFMAFASQMRLGVMSLTKFWVLFGLVSAFVVFKNWMRYNGKKRSILKAKVKTTHPVYLLWLLPFGCFLLAIILLQAV